MSRRFNLIYPIKSDNIHTASSKEDGVKRCYKEFKKMNDLPDGMFRVKDLDKNKEYQFQAIDGVVKIMRGGKKEEKIENFNKYIEKSDEEELLDLYKQLNNKKDDKKDKDNKDHYPQQMDITFFMRHIDDDLHEIKSSLKRKKQDDDICHIL